METPSRHTKEHTREINGYMLKRIFISAITAVAVIAFVGCSSKKSPKAIVKNFIKENLVNNNISDKDFSDADSTFYVTDSAIAVMRENANKLAYYKKNIKYVNHNKKKKIIFITLKYTMSNEKKQSQTFYLDEEGTGVIAFKNNEIK